MLTYLYKANPDLVYKNRFCTSTLLIILIYNCWETKRDSNQYVAVYGLAIGTSLQLPRCKITYKNLKQGNAHAYHSSEGVPNLALWFFRIEDNSCYHVVNFRNVSRLVYPVEKSFFFSETKNMSFNLVQNFSIVCPM